MKVVEEKKFRFLTAAICGAIGIAILINWAFFIAPQKINTDVFAMNPLTAVLLLLCSCALISPAKVRAAIGALVFAIAAAKLLAFFGFDLKLDQILFADKLNWLVPTPSRMAPHTAVSFLFLGPALFFWGRRLKNAVPVSDYLVLPALVIALIGGISYLYCLEDLAQLGDFIPIAPSTVIGILSLSLGILIEHRKQGLLSIFFNRRPSSVVGRIILPFVLVLPIVAGWIVIELERQSSLQSVYGTAFMAIGGVIGGAAMLSFGIGIINRLENDLEFAQRSIADNQLNRLRKFFPPDIADQIVAGENEDPFKWKRKDITVLFIDIRGFTPFAENCTPEQVMGLLQSYYSIVAKVAQKYQGSIGHLAGDGVMIFLNAPITIDHPELSAARMAIEIRKGLEHLWQNFRFEGLDLALGAGIASGLTIIGGMGSEGFWDYTVIGNAANMASRLCAAAREGQILVSKRFLQSLENRADAEPIGELELKGIKQPVTAFNIKNIN